jgi:uncharacterized protein CbrC (UPF0167 family)
VKDQLPTFRYHPDPIATGSVEASENVCIICNTARGYIYTGPVYCEAEITGGICPWCIADGSAHEALDAEFTDREGIGDRGRWDEIPDSVLEEVAYRTPSYSGWQQEVWFTHCNDAAAFLGAVGRNELDALGPEAIASIQASTDLEGNQWAHFFERLNKDGSPTAYLFRCLHCGTYGGTTDSD